MSEKEYNPGENEKVILLSQAEVISHELERLKEDSLNNPNEIIDPTAYSFIEELSKVAADYYHDGGVTKIEEDRLIALYQQVQPYESTTYRGFLRDLLREKKINTIILDAIIMESEANGQRLSQKELLGKYFRRNN